MKKVLAWLSSWGTTLRIMLFERETYRVLRQEGFRPEDFTEVSRPGGYVMNPDEDKVMVMQDLNSGAISLFAQDMKVYTWKLVSTSDGSHGTPGIKMVTKNSFDIYWGGVYSGMTVTFHYSN